MGNHYTGGLKKLLEKSVKLFVELEEVELTRRKPNGIPLSVDPRTDGLEIE